MLGVKWAVGPSFGSVAFSSLVQALFAMMRILLEEAANSDSSEGAAGVVKCVAVCCLKLISGKLDYFNKLAAC